MKKLAFVGVLIVLALPAIGKGQSKDALIGTWKLVSALNTSEKGEAKDAFGQNPTGLMTYTMDGRMMAIISSSGRKPLSVPDYVDAPIAERAEAFATFVAYAGTYTLENGRVIHHVQVASLQNRVGTDMVRTIIKLDSDRLIIRTPPFGRGGAMVTQELTWERVKGSAAIN